MQPIESPAYHILQCQVVNSFAFQPLTMLNKLNNVRLSSDTIWHSARSISCQTEKSDYSRPCRIQLWVISWLLDDVLRFFLDNRSHNRCCAVFVQIYPRPCWVIVSLFFLLSVSLNSLCRILRKSTCVLTVPQIFESLRVKNLLQ